MTTTDDDRVNHPDLDWEIGEGRPLCVSCRHWQRVLVAARPTSRGQCRQNDMVTLDMARCTHWDGHHDPR